MLYFIGQRQNIQNSRKLSNIFFLIFFSYHFFCLLGMSSRRNIFYILIILMTMLFTNLMTTWSLDVDPALVEFYNQYFLSYPLTFSQINY